MHRFIDPAALERQLISTLVELGPMPAAELCRRLEISQPTFSRLVARAPGEMLVLGRGRATRYAARRELRGVGSSVPIFRVNPDGSTEKLAQLHAVGRHGFFLEALSAEVDGGPTDDLPFFLHDLRPSGFLGRLLPRRHAELALPMDVRLWTAEHCLAYLTRYGWNTPGELLVGDEAFRLFLTYAQTPPDRVADVERERRYPELADDVLAAGVPGSSAAGEQPKFLATRSPGGPVLVKFSPPVRDELGARVADLLVAEHLVHGVVAAHGLPACRSTLLPAGERMFLEVERFDRVGALGRRGVLSLAALDLEYVGELRQWVRTAEALGRQRRLDAGTVQQIRWLQIFGGLIADSDMHPGNLSLFARGARPTALAPVYDLSPMAYAPRDGQLLESSFDPPLPSAADAPVWQDAHAAARELWHATAAHPLVSAAFRSIASANAEKVAALTRLGSLLPSDAH